MGWRAALAAALALVLLAGCGEEVEFPERVPTVTPAAAPAAPAPAAPAPPAPTVLATGLSEANAQLLWSPSDPTHVPAPEFAPWRDRVAALAPGYVRMSVDWSKLQPDPAQPAALDKPTDGCLRGLPPCGAYAGVREELQAIASQQRSRNGLPEVLVVIYGVPDWAAAPASGCERSDAGPRSRPITGAGLLAYQALLAQLVAVGESVGATVKWWSPWNEPNHPAFISPQRETCSSRAPSQAAAMYAELVRAASAALAVAPGDQQLVLGEMAGITGSTARSSSVSEVVADLPDEVACASRTWSQHLYAELERDPDDGDPVGALERALDARECTRGAHIWITETGAGGPDAGGPRPNDDASLREGCRKQAALLRRWADDPRVDVAFQYTFREDTVYPVGLADAHLTRTYPTYDLWKAWGERASNAPAPALPAACARTRTV